VRDVAGRPIGDELRALTADRIAARRASAEGREGLAAFIEKRKPEWAGGCCPQNQVIPAQAGIQPRAPSSAG
ncbi:MAG: hypothetical protein ACRCUI_06205, partial [Polymorphobacter sp.]